MKTKLLLSISLFLFVGNCWAQITFQRVISMPNGCGANSVQQTNDGGYIIAGGVGPLSSNLVYLVKTDNNGDTLWTKTFGGIYQNEGYSVQQTNDGGYVVAGFSESFDQDQNGEIYVIKTNAAGDTLWTKAYGGNDPYSSYNGYFIQQTKDSGYIITGTFDSLGEDGWDVCLFKINAAGDITWTKTYGGAAYDAAYCVKQTVDSGYIICGFTSSFGSGYGVVYLIKTKTNGDTLWTKTYGGMLGDGGNAVQQTSDSGFIIVGNTYSFGAGRENVYLIKTNFNGDTIWTKTYGSINSYKGAADVMETTDGGYIIAGTSNNVETGNDNIYLIKTNSSGDTLWTNTYGGVAFNYSNSIQQTTDGGYIIAGVYQVSPDTGTKCIYLIKTDAKGNSGCNQGPTNTIVGSTATQVGSTQTIVDSGGAASPTNTLIASGGNDSILCLTLGINELTLNNTITLYPNPATDQVVITGNWKENKTLLLTIYNIAGEKIYNETVNRKQETVNCKLLSSGVYFITVADENEQWVGRFVKE